jgi:hypothetical protein
METLGWVASICLALCGAPEAYFALKTGICNLGWTMLFLWGVGEVFALIYTLHKNKQVKLLPLIFNYGLNILFISVMIIVKVNQ